MNDYPRVNAHPPENISARVSVFWRSALAGGVGAILAVVMLVCWAGSVGAQDSNDNSSIFLPGDSSGSSSAQLVLNQGTYLLRANKMQDAIGKFQEALRISPNFADPHHQWGIALVKLGKPEQAVDQFKIAIQLNPQLAASWLSLGGAYQSAGDTKDAIQAYNDFLSRFPQDRDAGKIRKLITMLGREGGDPGVASSAGSAVASSVSSASSATSVPAMRPPIADTSVQPISKSSAYGSSASAAAGASASASSSSSNNSFLPAAAAASAMPRTAPPASANGSDYLAEVTKSGIVKWVPNRMPLRVFVEDGKSIPGYRPVFSVILKEAFYDWAMASDGLVSVVMVTDPAKANVVCRWYNQADKFQNGAECGETRLYSDRIGVARGEVDLLTVSTTPSLPLSDNRFRAIALHEVGHVLGLTGHTNDPKDIMFYSASASDNWRDLTARDKRTLTRLYRTN